MYVRPSYQSATRRCHTLPRLALCCRIVGAPVEPVWPPIPEFPATAAFFDLDKTIISKSSTLAFGPSFYRHGLISRTDVIRGALAQLAFRLSGASHQRMEKIREHVSQVCRGWPADRVAEIITRNLPDLI